MDDDRLILNLLEYTINNTEDYQVKTFSSGEDCINNLDMNPDLIVLDHYFQKSGSPAMNGIDIIKIIREKKINTPVIILTGHEDDEIAMEYFRYGASEYIAKNDLFIDNLMEVIAKHLA